MSVELHRGYQRIGVNFTSGKQDFHEAIDVSGVQRTNPMT